MFSDTRILIKGAGDLASGAAVRLFRAGFPIIMTEIPAPLAVRRSVAFAEAVYAGATHVEEIAGIRMTQDEVVRLAGEPEPSHRTIPVVVDPAASLVARLRPTVIVDAIMAKRNSGTTLADAPIVVALGPGFQAGKDCHAVIETNRGHNLGRVIWRGAAEADTGQPGSLPGMPPVLSRVLRAPTDGYVVNAVTIGSYVAEGGLIAQVRGADGCAAPVSAPFSGVLRGIIHPDVAVHNGMKIGDLDPRIAPENCFTVSDKSLAVGGGVLEAILMLLR